MEVEKQKRFSPFSVTQRGVQVFELDRDAKIAQEERGKSEIIKEVKRLIWLAGPLITVGFLQYSLQMISVIFVGHLGELALASASMATSFAGVTGYILIGPEASVPAKASFQCSSTFLVTWKRLDILRAPIADMSGCGWQTIGAYVNLGAYYLVGLPSAIILAFILRVGGKGFWMGITCGSSLQAFLLLMVTLRTNWEHEAYNARARVFNADTPKLYTKAMHAQSGPLLPQEPSDLLYNIVLEQ